MLEPQEPLSNRDEKLKITRTAKLAAAAVLVSIAAATPGVALADDYASGTATPSDSTQSITETTPLRADWCVNTGQFPEYSGKLHCAYTFAFNSAPIAKVKRAGVVGSATGPVKEVIIMQGTTFSNRKQVAKRTTTAMAVSAVAPSAAKGWVNCNVPSQVEMSLYCWARPS